MYRKNKGFKILFIIYILFFLGDLISTIINGELIQYLEANLLFKYGGLPLIVIINIGIMFFLYKWYNKTNNNTSRFIIHYLMVAIIITRIIAIYFNIDSYLNPPTIEAAKAVTEQAKDQTIMLLTALNILPYFNALITWLFFQMDHIIISKK